MNEIMYYNGVTFNVMVSTSFVLFVALTGYVMEKVKNDNTKKRFKTKQKD